MKASRRLRWSLFAIVLLGPDGAAAQGRGGTDPAQAYLRAVGEHFRVPAQEVVVLGEWGLSPEEIPVVLFLARRGGMSADALVTLKRGGQSWWGVAERLGLDAGAFHVPIPESASGAPLGGAYARYRGRPGDWRGLALDDAEVLGLVNVRFLSDYTGTAPARVLEAAERSGSWVLAYRSLVSR